MPSLQFCASHCRNTMRRIPNSNSNSNLNFNCNLNSATNTNSSCTSSCNANATTNLRPRPCSSDVAEQCGRYVLHELLTTEQQYVEDLTDGIHRYTRIFQLDTGLPEGLVGQQHVLLSNVAQIAALHRHKLLPLMLQHRQQLELLFECWHSLIEHGCFNCYVLFTASQRDSLRLYDSHELYFKVSSPRIEQNIEFIHYPTSHPITG